jgi:hypothetical protein
MTTSQEPGERRPASTARTTLDRPPSDRYRSAKSDEGTRSGRVAAAGPAAAVVALGAVAFVVFGGVLTVTAGLVVVAALIGWIIGLLVGPPLRAALVAVVAVVVGLLGIWLFGRWEGGVLDPLQYFAEVQGILVPIELLVAAGLAAAASR